jgi:hypothetical protein
VYQFVTEPRWAAGKPEHFPGLAAELVRLRVDVIVAAGPALPALKKATSTIPVVMGGDRGGAVDSHTQSPLAVRAPARYLHCAARTAGTFPLDGWLVGVVRRTHQEGKDSEQRGTQASARRLRSPQLALSRDIGTCGHGLPDRGAGALRWRATDLLLARRARIRLVAAAGPPRSREWVFAFPALRSAMSAGVSAFASR